MSKPYPTRLSAEYMYVRARQASLQIVFYIITISYNRQKHGDKINKREPHGEGL
jgi:hypothetical protein